MNYLVSASHHAPTGKFREKVTCPLQGHYHDLTATISAGSNVTYTWNFGDGSSTVMGHVVTHTYPFSTTSRFTATVTALNSVNAQSAATTIIIVPRRVYLPVVIR